MYTFYLYIILTYYIYKICLLIKFAPDPFLILPTSIYTDLPLPTPICRSWTSLGNTVFTQIVSSYNYERLIRSISTPNVYALFLLIFLLLFLRPFYLPTLFIPLLSPSFISTPLLVLIFVHLYFYSLSFYSLLLSPLYVHIICTPFS